jgi:hypothetical protein
MTACPKPAESLSRRRLAAGAIAPNPDLGGASRATGWQSREGREASHTTNATAGPTLTARRRALPQFAKVGVGLGRTEQRPRNDNRPPNRKTPVIGSQRRGARLSQARFLIPLSIRACGSPAHGLPMIFLMVTTRIPGSEWCLASGRGHGPQTTRASRPALGRDAGCVHSA